MRIVALLAIAALAGCTALDSNIREQAHGKLANYFGLVGDNGDVENRQVNCVLDRMSDDQIRAFVAAQDAEAENQIMNGVQDVAGLTRCWQALGRT